MATLASAGVQLYGEFFGRLSEELIIKIISYAVTEDKVIKPKQVRDGSNKFIHGSAEWSNGRYTSTEPNKLCVPAVMATCKGFYDIVNSSAAFYGLNKFEFDGGHDLLPYLSSITPARIQDLRDITMKCGWYGLKDKKLKSAFTLLSTCTKLRNFTLVVPNGAGFLWGLRLKSRDVKELIGNVRCENPQLLRIDNEGIGQQAQSVQHTASYEDASNALESDLKQIMTSPAVQPTDYELLMARQASGVQVHGDGRLEGELKPGLISSRTRQGKSKKARLDDDGVLKQELQLKFAMDGALLWDVLKIHGHREIVDEENSETKVELQIEWSLDKDLRIGGEAGLTWEDLDILLTNPRTFGWIWSYYKDNKLWGKVPGAHKMLAAAKEFDDHTEVAFEEELKAIKSKTRRFREQSAFAGNHSYRTEFEQAVKAHESYIPNMEKEAAKAQKAAAKAQKATGSKRKRGD